MIAHVQVLRFVAAFWVVLYHARPPIIPAEAMPALPALWTAVASMGFFGVDIFFVISGAIMAEATRAPAAGNTPARFVARRFARIYTGWWPFFLLYLVAHLLYRGLGEKNLLGSFLLLPLHHYQYLVPIVWTLSFELYFYAVLGVLLMLPSRRAIGGVLAAWGVATLAFVAWQMVEGAYRPERFAGLGLLHFFFLSPLVLEFIAGFLLCEWLRGGDAPHPRAGWPWLLLGVGGTVAAYAYEHLMSLESGGLAGWYHTPERVALLGTAACGFVAAALVAAPPRGRWAPALVALGDASYALYLCHILLLGGVYHLLAGTTLPAVARYALFAAVLAGICVYAVLHHRWIERPLYRRAGRIVQRLPAGARKEPS